MQNIHTSMLRSDDYKSPEKCIPKFSLAPQHSFVLFFSWKSHSVDVFVDASGTISCMTTR